MAKKSKSKIEIEPHFRQLIEAYGFSDPNLLDKAVATRSSEDWFAILFRDDTLDDGFFAVDFRYYGQSQGAFDDCIKGWGIQNDEIGPFDTIEEFETEELTRSFF
jgi:hypothetical protein